MEKYEGSCASIGNTSKATPTRQIGQQIEALQKSVDSLHLFIDDLHGNLCDILHEPYPKVEQNKAKDACKPDEAQLVPLAVQLHRIRSRVISAADMISNINTRLEL